MHASITIEREGPSIRVHLSLGSLFVTICIRKKKMILSVIKAAHNKSLPQVGEGELRPAVDKTTLIFREVFEK